MIYSLITFCSTTTCIVNALSGSLWEKKSSIVFYSEIPFFLSPFFLKKKSDIFLEFSSLKIGGDIKQNLVDNLITTLSVFCIN